MVIKATTAPVKTATPAATQPTPATPTTTPTVATIGEPKTSIFKKWWLWAIIAAIIIVGAYFIFF